MELYQDPRFRALTASQRSALQLLPKLMAEYGRDGILRWTRREICEAVQLRPKPYAALLEMMSRHGWGGENAEGWLVLSLPSAAAEKAAIIEEARPGIIREYEAERKQKSRVPVSGTCPGNVPEMSRTSEVNFQETSAAYIDTPACAFDRSIDIERDNILSNSNDRSIEPPTPIQETKVALTMVPADVAQELVRKGISSRRAQVLIDQHTLERCAFALACLPHWKVDNAGKAIESFLADPGKWKIPKEVGQGSLPLLTGAEGGAAPKVETPKRVVPSIQEVRARLTEPERQALRLAALDRLQRVSRAEYDKAISMDRPPGAVVMHEIQTAEDSILRAGRQRAAG